MTLIPADEAQLLLSTTTAVTMEANIRILSDPNFLEVACSLA